MGRAYQSLISFVLSVGVFGASVAAASQGMILTKSCPVEASSSGTATCTIKIQNQDPDNGLLVDSVTNQYPVPGGPVYQIYSCDADADMDGAFALAPGDGVPGGPDTTECDIVESITTCTGGSVTVVDKAFVQGRGGVGGNTPLTGGPVHNAVRFLCSGNPGGSSHTSGQAFSKSCGFANEGEAAICTVRIQNLDPDHGLQINQVTNEYPFPGGTVSQVFTCLADSDMDGSFLLGPSDGVAGGSDTTDCPIAELLNQPCTGVATSVADKASMSGYDVGTGGPASATASEAALFICEPCGNGVLDAGEQCDAGDGNNGGAGSCCAANCQYKANGSASCDGNLCTRPDTCTNGVCTAGSCATGACSFCGGTCTNSGGACTCVY